MLNEGLEVLGTDDSEWPDGVFERSRVETVSLPSTLKRIERGSFKECLHLNSVQLPNRLEEIGLHVFEGSGLESVELPSSVRVIHQGAFYKCWNLR